MSDPIFVGWKLAKDAFQTGFGSLNEKIEKRNLRPSLSERPKQQF